MVFTSVYSPQDILSLKAENWVLIFKYSSTCSFSGGAYNLLNTLNFPGKAVLITVQSQRSLSDFIVHTFSQGHATPQVIILQNGVVKGVLSGHNAISAFAIQNILNT